MLRRLLRQHVGRRRRFSQAHDPAVRVAELRDWLARCSQAYYGGEDPLASDAEFDVAMAELAHLEARFPSLRSPTSPTDRVGAPPESHEPVAHSSPMLSLRSVTRLADVHAFLEQTAPSAWTVERKYDGMAIALRYDRHGRFRRAISRGDGEFGDDVTDAVRRAARNLPVHVRNDMNVAFEVRGEAVMPIGSSAATGPLRNQVAGLLRRKLNGRASSSIDLICYQLLLTSGGTQRSHVEDMSLLKSLGFTVDTGLVPCQTPDQVAAAIHDLQASRATFPYESDGVVVKVDASEARLRLGSTARAPRWALAFKFDALQAKSILERIELSVGRTGKVTPVAIVRPVTLGGVVVSRATLHNARHVLQFGIVQQGDVVRIQRSGDVIPHVVRVEPVGPRADRDDVFDVCPCTRRSKLRFEDGEPDAWCVDPHCPSVVVARLVYAVSKNALDVRGLGESAIRQLVDVGLIRDIPDLFDLRQPDLVALPRWDTKKAAAAIASIEMVRERVDQLGLVTSLGIDGVGRTVARRLLDHFGQSGERLLRAPAHELREVKGVGERVASALAAFVASDRARHLLERFRALGMLR
ncbi:unnamed protein product (mitochondrion) [Plasmodiophora brassicae]|uniref:DNA ligase (NAD(+)) n=1 Tax=Plasmodiophora brassicae TaxID=37360 RepID=A0A0G4IQI0_PLABS|nr:hypothetical protein PBRA_000730 [Plasmodiophora brassicae]SPQ97697.1 unnamed protein product [Plasmodiophora brassicae]